MSLEELRRGRRNWVEATRDNGFDAGIKRLLTDLYPDNAHFIYELLQNAEDAEATEVRFILKEDGIEFEHNGNRLFTLEDVKSITSIGDSPKKDDPTSIGKFGVGFKAVFAYTSTPEIASGKYHFRISDLVVPDTEGLPPCALDDKETRFTFPFDNSQKPPERAREEIEKNLRQLDESSLLFLSNIRKIEYLLPDSALGFLERKETDGNRIEILVQHPEDSEPASIFFLRFERTVEVNDEDGRLKCCRVAVAFGLEKPQGQEWKIRPLDPGRVCIYFPAEKETSKLRFHLHAPFASTVARDSVRDCSANDELRDRLSDLIAESMITLRDQGLLNVQFLAILPNSKDSLSPFYSPIQDQLVKTFRNEELTPMKQGGHAAALGIYRGGRQLSDLINDEDLTTILGEGPRLMWAANPPQRNQGADDFLSMLSISEWKTENLVNTLSESSETVMKWLAEKSDAWLQQLYILLSGEPIWKVRSLRIVRLSNGDFSVGEKCFFPTEGMKNDQKFLRVAEGVYSSGSNEEQKEKICKFLEALGVRKLDIVEEVIEGILPKYEDSSATVDPEQNAHDLKKIERAYETDSREKKRRLQTSLRRTPFILAECLNEGETAYRKPNRVYFSSDDLRTYFAENDSFACVTANHPYAKLLRELGVEEAVRIRRKLGDSKQRVTIQSDYGDHERGLNGFDPYICVDGLEYAISTPCLEKSVFIWNEIAVPNSDCIRGVVEKSTRRTYEGSEEEKQISEFGELLTDNAWLPDLNGHWHRPSALTLDDLPESFVRNERLADQLGMKKNVVAELAEKAGVSQTSLGRAKRFEEASPEIQQRIEDILLREEKKKKTPQQEDRPYDEALSKAFSASGKEGANNNGDDGGFSSNPSRRRKKTSEDIAATIKNRNDPEERSYFSVRKNWEAKNDQVRADFVEWYSGRCQICDWTFSRRNGEPYFEGLYLVSRTTADWVDRVGNVLCLCAQHSVMFQFGSKEVDEDIIQQVMRLKTKAEGGDGYPAIRMKLCGDPIEIKFAEKHLIDLQEMIRTAQESGV